MKKPSRLDYGPDQIKTLRTAFGDLVDQPIFTVWDWKKKPDGEWSKVPTHPHGTPGITFEEARALQKSHDGLGVKFGRIPGTAEDVLFGVDYDGVKKGPLPTGWPESKTYAEHSPSGDDRFHILGRYKGVPYEGRKVGAVEIYTDARYFTLTGQRINGAAILQTDPLAFYAAIGHPNPAPYGTKTGKANGSSYAPLTEAELTERERKWLDKVRVIKNDDRSKRDFIVLARLLEMGATDAQATRILLAGFWRVKLRRADYIAGALARLHAEEENATAFRKESQAIGEGTPETAEHFPRLFSVAELLAEAVFISDGSQVALRTDPRIAYSHEDFARLTAASTVRSGSKGRPANVAGVWLRHPQRITVHARTFRAGADLFTQSPGDVLAINTWREPPRGETPGEWQRVAGPFLEHVKFLVPESGEREFFLDWLAHIEQAPGVLPHVHVLMIATRHGVGRNLLASILARVWPGVTALDVDLGALLDGKFNGRLSRKTFAVVNEIREGGSSQAYRHADALKGLLTNETRVIDPKYGRQYEEFNSVRWMMFSNHENALPLDSFDRRIYAIQNPDNPQSPAYYARLYAMAADGAFIESVREFLRVRNISKFNPGMHAPLTATKQRVIDAGMSEAELVLMQLRDDYPSDCITTPRLCALMFGNGYSRRDAAVLKHIAGRQGVRAYPHQVTFGYPDPRPKTSVRILRNPERWLAEERGEIAKEVLKGEAAK